MGYSSVETFGSIHASAAPCQVNPVGSQRNTPKYHEFMADTHTSIDGISQLFRVLSGESLRQLRVAEYCGLFHGESGTSSAIDDAGAHGYLHGRANPM
jgi:hypothetical protein